MQTDFPSKVSILGDLWSNYQDDKEFREFISFNDIGLPLAYFVAEKLAVETDAGTRFIEETFDLFMDALGIEDTGFEFLDEVFTKAALEGK
jgi:hypothetical protein